MNRSERTHYWQQQIDTWDRSGLSGAAFCKRSALSYNQFAYWRRKLQEPDEAAESEPSPGFVRVRQATSVNEPDELTLTLPSGVTITGLHAGNVTLLGAVLREL